MIIQNKHYILSYHGGICLLKFNKILTRHGEYALVRKNGSSEYVLPLRSAEKTEYNPSETITDALLDIMRIGWLHNNGKETAEPVLAYCRRYGFLGFTKIHLSFRDYSRGRFPDWNRSPVSYAPNAFENELKWQTGTFRRRYDKEPNHEIAEKYDCSAYERLDDFKTLGCWLLDLLRRISDERQIEMYIDDTPLIHFENGQPIPVQPADCLAGAILSCFYLSVTESSAKVRLCKRCCKPFYATNARAEYCSSSCRNVANVKASRHRRREKESGNQE